MNLLQHRLEDSLVAAWSGFISQSLTRITNRHPRLAAVEMEIRRLEEPLAAAAEVHVTFQAHTILWHLQTPTSGIFQVQVMRSTTHSRSRIFGRYNHTMPGNAALNILQSIPNVTATYTVSQKTRPIRLFGITLSKQYL